MVSKSEISECAKKLNKLNKFMTESIYLAEGLVRNPVYLECIQDNREVIKLLSKAYKKLNKNNEDFADGEFHGSVFADLKCFVNELNKITVDEE